jgi:hypothetical protein
MVKFFSAILMCALLELVFGPLLDDAREGLAEWWAAGRAVAGHGRRQRGSSRDSLKPADTAWP